MASVYQKRSNLNSIDFRSEKHSRLTWGPAQAGVAEGILTAVQRRIIPPEQVDEYLAIATVWVDWNAESEEKVFQNNKDAAFHAMERAFGGEPGIEDLLARLGHAENPFLTRSQGEAEG
jgi:5,6,7,8-tetrahydromethanopterin hydro-lyase